MLQQIGTLSNAFAGQQLRIPRAWPWRSFTHESLDRALPPGV